MREVKVDSSGRVTIPKDLRLGHHLKAGSRLLLIDANDRMTLVPRPENSIVERAGILVFRGVLTGEIADHRQLREDRTRFSR